MPTIRLIAYQFALLGFAQLTQWFIDVGSVLGIVLLVVYFVGVFILAGDPSLKDVSLICHVMGLFVLILIAYWQSLSWLKLSAFLFYLAAVRNHPEFIRHWEQFRVKVRRLMGKHE